MDEPTYGDGLEEGRSEIANFIFSILVDIREKAVNGSSSAWPVWVVDHISHRLDSYLDDLKGVWSDVG